MATLRLHSKLGSLELVPLSKAAELVETFLDAFTQHDLSAALACLDDEVYFVPGGDEATPSRGDFSGHDGFRAWWEREDPDGFEVTTLELTALDPDHVFADLMFSIPAGESWLSIARGSVYTICDGKIVAIEEFSSPRAALRAR